MRQVHVGAGEVAITYDVEALAAALTLDRDPDAPAVVTLSCPAKLARSGTTLRLVQDNGAVATAAADQSLVRLLLKARAWWAILRTGQISPTELAAELGVTRSYVARVVRLAFLAPAVTEAILAGRQRAGVTVASLTVEGGIVPDWSAQQAAMLPTVVAR